MLNRNSLIRDKNVTVGSIGSVINLIKFIMKIPTTPSDDRDNLNAGLMQHDVDDR